MGNSFGKLFKLTSFGESHGKVIGGVIDGCPSNIEIDFDYIQNKLDRRKPGQSDITTDRKEDDKLEILSGVFENKTLGTPLAFIIKNKSFDSSTYKKNKDFYRPSHADYSYQKKYNIRDYRGGGRSSARETISRVVAGSIADIILRKYNVEIYSYVSKIYDFSLDLSYSNIDKETIEKNILRFPDNRKAEEIISFLKQVKNKGDSVGGEITTVVKGLEAGIGEPVFDKLNAKLANALMSINAAKSFKLGFQDKDISASLGSEVNDELISTDGKTKTNYSGGIQGGISNGNDLIFTTGFKPVSSIKIKQNMINSEGMRKEVKIEGKHDPCVVPRAVPIVESMTSMVILDYIFINNSRTIRK